MILLLLLLLAFLLIIMIEAPGLIKKNMWRELAAFSVLMIIGMVYSILLFYGIHLNPNVPLEALFKPMMNMLKNP
jgi:hypothetical protein